MISRIMIKLGNYIFSVHSAAYGQLRRSVEYRWPAQERIGRRPARQFVGAGNETIELDGVVYPHYQGGLRQVDYMRSEAGKGVPLMLTTGLGAVLGLWCIERIEETAAELCSDGAPKKIEFRLALGRYGEDA